MVSGSFNLQKRGTKGMEDKKIIAKLLKLTLQQCEGQKEIKSIKLTNDGQAQELAIIEYYDSRENLIVNITYDSGLMMIKDIINAVEI